MRGTLLLMMVIAFCVALAGACVLVYKAYTHKPAQQKKRKEKDPNAPPKPRSAVKL